MTACAAPRHDQPAEAEVQLAAKIHAFFIAMQRENGQWRSLPWDDEDPQTRAIAIEGIKRIRTSLTSGMSVEKIAEHHHHAWVAAKQDAGWTLGEFDREAKTHPNLVHWRDLPEHEQDKCGVFIALVAWFYREAG